MFYLFVSVLTVLILTMTVLAISVTRKYNSISRSLTYLLLSSIFTILFYLLSVIGKTHNHSLTMLSLYFCGMDFTLTCLLQFTFTITEINRKSIVHPLIKYACISILLLDGILLISNIFTKQIFDVEWRISPVEKEHYWNVIYNSPFYLHLITDYIITSLIFGRILYKIIKSSSFFRKRYTLVFIGFALVIGLHVAFNLNKWAYDYSVICYAFLTFLSWYFSFISIPSNVISIILNRAAETTESALVCYNNKNEEIFANTKALTLFDENFGFKQEITELHEKFLINISKHNDEYLKHTKIFDNLSQNIIFSVEHKIIRDKRKRLIGSYIKLDERTDEINKINAERYKASHDELTGLLNRANFFDEVSRSIDAEPDCLFYMVATDLKSFKLVNDLFGTRFGDDVLKLEANLIQKHGYISGRISSDKFAIFLKKKDNTHKELMHIIHEVQAITKNLNYKLQMYMGVYEIANPYENVQSMYDKAYLAIKKIYGTYDNNISYYDTSLMESLIHQKSIIRDFNNAREKDEIKMYLQPQFDAKTSKCIGAEALIRWNNSKRGHLSPDKFVHILEKGGYIYNMDHLIWEKAAETLSRWQEMGSEKYISVNISARDFYYEDLFKVFKGLVEKYNISPSKMNLEITETVLMHDTEANKHVINKLKEYGFKVEMDDFGSGFSSLNNLQNLDMDVLKIDMEFLAETKNAKRSEAILASIIQMAKNLGMTVITEGVEHKEQADLLKKLGSDIFQGYFYSKPVTAEEFEKTFMRNE